MKPVALYPPLRAFILVGLAVGLALVGGPTRAAPPEVPLASPIDRQRLARLDALVAAGSWDEAVGVARALSEQADLGTLVPVEPPDPTAPPGFVLYEPLGRALNRRVAAWRKQAPEALDRYRATLDPVVEAWLARAPRDADLPRVWRHIRDTCPCASQAPEVLLALGEWAFQQGRFLEAQFTWTLLDPLQRTPAGRPAWLVPPRSAATSSGAKGRGDDPGLRRWLCIHVDPAATTAQTARGALGLLAIVTKRNAMAQYCQKMLGDTADAPVVILGEKATWRAHANRLRRAIAVRKPSGPANWPLPWGEATGAATLPAIDLDDHPCWIRRLHRARPVGPDASEPLQAVQPVAADGRLFWRDAGAWYGVDIATGRAEHRAADRAVQRRSGLEAATAVPPRSAARLRSLPEFGWFVTWESGRLNGVARRITRSEDGQAPRSWQSVLVALDPHDGRLRQYHVWDEPWSLGDAGVVHDGIWYGVASQVESGRSPMEVWAMDLSTGRRVWRASIGKSPRPVGDPTWPAAAVTFVDGWLFVCNHGGLVAALDASDGSYRWVHTYPPASGEAAPPFDRIWRRRLGPPWVAGDLVVVAPGDSDRVLAFDALTGALRWATAPGVVEGLTGIWGQVGRFVIGGGQRVWWIDRLTGEAVFAFPAPGIPPATIPPALRGAGRGLVTEDGTIVWPTADRIWILDGARRCPRRPPILLRPFGLSGGALLWHRGFLVLAGPEALAAWRAQPR